MKTKLEKLFTRRTSNIFHSQKRRAREAGQELDYTLDQLRSLVSHVVANGCPYCSNAVSVAEFEVDHLVPTCRGGQHALANIAACCASCNAAKGPLEFREYCDLLITLGKFAPTTRRNVLARLKVGGRIVKGV